MSPNQSAGGYEERTYRSLLCAPDSDLVPFQVRVKESDLFIRAARDLREAARESILRHRYVIEQYLFQHPDFFRSLAPLPPDPLAPPLIGEMLRAAQCAAVGPMAAVAGALAECVGRDLLEQSPQVIVENGGDLFLRTAREVRVAIYAGCSPLSLRLGLKVPPAAEGCGLCTSSGTVGPSLSFGRADAVSILAPSAALADAAATAVGNEVRKAGEIPQGLARAQAIPGLRGALIIVGEKMGAWGEMELITFKTPKDRGPAGF